MFFYYVLVLRSTAFGTYTLKVHSCFLSSLNFKKLVQLYLTKCVCNYYTHSEDISNIYLWPLFIYHLQLVDLHKGKSVWPQVILRDCFLACMSECSFNNLFGKTILNVRQFLVNYVDAIYIFVIHN